MSTFCQLSLSTLKQRAKNCVASKRKTTWHLPESRGRFRPLINLCGKSRGIPTSTSKVQVKASSRYVRQKNQRRPITCPRRDIGISRLWRHLAAKRYELAGRESSRLETRARPVQQKKNRAPIANPRRDIALPSYPPPSQAGLLNSLP